MAVESDSAAMSACLADVRARIDRAARRAGRDAASVRLVAVSKGHPASAIRTAYALGLRDFGENYVQELIEKAASLADLDGLRWHAIGRLQRNKARDVARLAALVHTVDRPELAHDLARRAATLGRTLEVLVEVNVAGEASKGGCAPKELDAVIEAIRSEPSLVARGLMTIAPDAEDLETVRPIFAELRELRDRRHLAELSMGMSHDLEIAIEEGATLVRVGTAIFGARAAPAR